MEQITRNNIQRRGPGDSLKNAAKRARFDARVTSVQPNDYLTNLSVGYSQDGFIADRVAPRIMVPKETGTFPVWGRDAFWADRKTGTAQTGLLRTVRQESASWDASPSTGSYECEEYALNFLLDDREQNTWAKPELAYTDMVTQALALDREVRVAALLNSTTYMAVYTTLSGTSQWSDVTSGDSDPIGDLETAFWTIQKNSGKLPNVAYTNPEVFAKLRRHPDMTEMFKVQNGPITGGQLTQAISDIAGSPVELLIGSAIYNNANEGATYSGAWVWADYFGLMYVPPSPGLYTPATCYQVVSRDRTVVTDRINTKHSDWYEISEVQDEIVPTANASYLIVDAIA